MCVSFLTSNLVSKQGRFLALMALRIDCETSLNLNDAAEHRSVNVY